MLKYHLSPRGRHPSLRLHLSVHPRRRTCDRIRLLQVCLLFLHMFYEDSHLGEHSCENLSPRVQAQPLLWSLVDFLSWTKSQILTLSLAVAVVSVSVFLLVLL
jgi:hypothetical protein